MLSQLFYGGCCTNFYQMLRRYKDSLTDLMSLLKLDAANAAAKKEVGLVKAAYKTVSCAISVASF